MRSSETGLSDLEKREFLAFIPDRAITEEEFRRLLAEDSRDQRAWAVTRLLLYADWEEIWSFVSREQVVELFGELELPPALRAAWARMLQLEEATAPAP